MMILLAALLTLIPVTVSAGSSAGMTAGHSRGHSADGAAGFGIRGGESRLPESRQPSFPRIGGGRGFWPMFGYPQVPNLTIVDVQVQNPEQPPPPPPKPPAPAKFWTARCGTFVELQVSPTMNLIEEEQKGCKP